MRERLSEKTSRKTKVIGSQPYSEKDYKMTNREFMEMVIAGQITDEMKEYAQHALDVDAVQKEKAAARRAEKAAEKHLADIPRLQAIAEHFSEVPMTATDLAKVMGYVTKDGKPGVQKASADARACVREGLAVQTEVKVAGKGVQKAYIRA